MATTTVDITPDISLLRKSGEVNYKLADAVAELVDNPLDEREPGQKLTIEVTIGQKAGEKYLQVVDDARGMTPEQAADAMVLARSHKGKGKIGHFGMGMKTACSNLGSHFEITTCTGAATMATKVVYDEEQFLAGGKWELVLEEVEKPFDHGTQIVITKPKANFYAGVKDIMLAKFGKLFKHYVASGEVEIIVNKDAVEPYMAELIPQYDTPIAFDVNGKTVRGWAGLTAKGNSRGAYGFDLVRQNRVIKEHEKLGFSPAAALTRLVGELHLDDFDVTNNKTDFRMNTEDWAELSKRLDEFLVDLKRESRKLANPGRQMTPKQDAEVQEHIEAVQQSLKTQELAQDLDRRALDVALSDEFAEGPLPFAVQGDEGEGEPAGNAPAAGPSSGAVGGGGASVMGQHRMNRIKTQLRNLDIEHQVMRLGRETAYKIWDVEGVGNKKKLLVTTNIDHPFYMVIQDGFLLWVRHNIVEAVAEFFTQETGTTEAMLLVKSDILKHIGKMTMELIDDSESGDAPEAAAV